MEENIPQQENPTDEIDLELEKNEQIRIEEEEHHINSEDDEYNPSNTVDTKSEFIDFGDLKPFDKTDKNRIKFSLLTHFFKKFGELKGRKKSEFLYIFLNEIIFKHDRKNAFAVLRLIIPEHDRERHTYGLREVNLGKLLSDAFSLPTTESNRLKFYKNPNYQPVGAPTGDFATVLYSVIVNLCRPDSSITIGEINEFLDSLAKTDDYSIKVKLVIPIIRKCNGEDLKWLSRIILKELKIGLHHEKVLTCYHPEALDFYNMTSNLNEACKEFLDPKHTLTNVLRLFHPIKPMLSGKRQLDEIYNILAGKTVFLEVKYDGERIQCHFNNDGLKFFSRNANDYTHLYGPKLTDIVRRCVKAQSAILDGEIIVINKHTDQLEAFGANKSVALNNSESDLQLCYKIFDILYVKGPHGEECNLMSLKLSDRKKILKRIISPEKNLLELVEGYETSNLADIPIHFEAAIGRNEEGIIIKQADSVYVARERSTTWLKMKADYMEGVYDTLDLAIIGGYYGEGYSKIGPGGQSIDHVTHFLVGLAQKIDKSDPLSSLFIPFCRVGTGYKGFELESLRTKLKPHLIKSEGRSKPRYLVNWNPAVSDRPDYFVDNPKNSVILEIKAAEFIKSNNFPCDYTLRFPRVEKIRYDKDWHEAMTYEEFQKTLHENQKAFKKSKKRGRDASPIQENEKSDQEAMKRKRVKTAKELSVLPQFSDTDVSHIQVEGDLFKNCEFYFVNNDNLYGTKSQLEELVCKHGGSKVQNFLMTNTHIIASHRDFKVDAILKSHPCNILYPKWIIDSVRKGQLQDYAPKYLMYALPWLKTRNEEVYDKYGDSFIIDVDKEGLKDFLKDLSKEGMEEDEEVEVGDLKNKLKDRLIEIYHVFKDKKFFILPTDSNYEKMRIIYEIMANGGLIYYELINDIDFIFDDNYNKKELEMLQKYRQIYKKCKVIDSATVFEMIRKNRF